GHVAAPIFKEFMEDALADKPATPFRIPPGIKLVRVNLKTGLRASPDDPDSIMEAFKPNEEPDDAYSVIGLSTATPEEAAQGDPYSPARDGGDYRPARRAAPSAGAGGLC